MARETPGRVLLMDGLFDWRQGEEDESSSGDGVTVPDLLEMPDDLRRVLNALTRMGGGTVSEVCARLDIGQDEALARLQQLTAQNHVHKSVSDTGEVVYRTRFARKRLTRLPGKLRDALEGPRREGSEDPA